MPVSDPLTPLPVMARPDAVGWARHLTAYLAQAAGAVLLPQTADAYVGDCVGRHGEVAADGRYTLAYAVTGVLPSAGHPEAVRAVRAALEERGFTVGGYRETREGGPDALLDASRPGAGYLVAVESAGGPDRLLFRVHTRCLTPPPGPSGG